jgi:anti-sigma regulatory factor (Ser/Thr protein kinase)
VDRANVLEHGAGAHGEIGVTLRRQGRGLEVEVTDAGRPFDPTALSDIPTARSIEAARIGGRGLRLLRSYAADISYRHDGSRNRLRLHLPAANS